jgi:HAE1 family hydrophobic/amphiphilic exporter-1
VFEVMQEVRHVQNEIPGLRLRASVQPALIGGGGSTPINIRLTGESMRTLEELAGQVEEIIRNTAGTVDIRNEAAVGEPEIRAFLDRQRMSDMGVTAAQVGTALRTAIGGTTITQLRVEGQPGIDITVLANSDLRNDLTALANIPIPLGLTGGATTTATAASTAGGGGNVAAPGTTVRLGQVADLRLVTGPTTISRSDRLRQVAVLANLQGRSVGDAARDIRAGLARLSVPSGYNVRFIGQVDQLDRARVALLSALTISILHGDRGHDAAGPQAQRGLRVAGAHGHRYHRRSH